jgi:transcriptional regulator with XRE-family HTH domain
VRAVGKDFGAELRRLRLAAGLSLHDLAVLIHYSRGHLSKIENNMASPSAALARLADAAVHAEGKLIAFLDKHLDQEQLRTETPGEAWAAVMDPESGTWFATVARGHALAQWASSAQGFSVSPVTDVGAAQAEPVLRAFRSAFEEIRASGRLMDPRFLLPVIWARSHVLRELSVAARPAIRRASFVLAARYAEFAGWMAQEAGDDRAALWWTDLAVQLAEEGGDAVLGAYAIVRRALVTLYHGDAAGTVDLAQRAQASEHVPMSVRGLAALREAQGLAMAGEGAECHRAIERGAGYLARADTADALLPALGSTSVADPAAMTAGWCLYDLGRPAEAAVTLGREIALIPPEGLRARTRYAARQALATATAGEVDKACELTRDILPSAHDLGSATIRHDLRQLARTFRRWPAHPQVRQVQFGLDQIVRVPVPPVLPAI